MRQIVVVTKSDKIVCEAKNNAFLFMKQKKGAKESKSPGKYDNPEALCS